MRGAKMNHKWNKEVSVPLARTDQELARIASDHIRFGGFGLKTIKVQVSGGVVTLEGIVEWPYQKQQATYGLLNLSGVKGIHNKITNSKMPEVIADPAAANARSLAN
jgi:hypothetical protein